MSIFRTSNPTLKESIFQPRAYDATSPMTIGGTVNKTAILLLLTVVSGAWVWGRAAAGGGGWAVAASVVALAVAFAISFKREWAPYLAPVYALAEGLMLGSVSALLEASYPGIVTRAVALTLAVMFAMLTCYRAGWIKVTEKFRSVIVAATLGVALVYLLRFVLSLFGVGASFMAGGGTLAVVITVAVAALAALNLLLDFDLIEQGAAAGQPKYMEWYAAFGLMVTLVWLYVELLRLLAILASRRD